MDATEEGQVCPGLRAELGVQCDLNRGLRPVGVKSPGQVSVQGSKAPR